MTSGQETEWALFIHTTHTWGCTYAVHVCEGVMATSVHNKTDNFFDFDINY